MNEQFHREIIEDIVRELSSKFDEKENTPQKVSPGLKKHFEELIYLKRYLWENVRTAEDPMIKYIVFDIWSRLDKIIKEDEEQ